MNERIKKHHETHIIAYSSLKGHDISRNYKDEIIRKIEHNFLPQLVGGISLCEFFFFCELIGLINKYGVNYILHPVLSILTHFARSSSNLHPTI